MDRFNEVARTELARYVGLRDYAKRRLELCKPDEDESPKCTMQPDHAQAVQMIESEIALCDAMIKLIRRDKATRRTVGTPAE